MEMGDLEGTRGRSGPRETAVATVTCASNFFFCRLGVGSAGTVWKGRPPSTRLPRLWRTVQRDQPQPLLAAGMARGAHPKRRYESTCGVRAPELCGCIALDPMQEILIERLTSGKRAAASSGTKACRHARNMRQRREMHETQLSGDMPHARFHNNFSFDTRASRLWLQENQSIAKPTVHDG